MVPCGNILAMGYPLKRCPLSKDEEGKHSKMKRTEKRLPKAGFLLGAGAGGHLPPPPPLEISCPPLKVWDGNML